LFGEITMLYSTKTQNTKTNANAMYR